MEVLDSTVIATALPAIAADFNTAPAHLSQGVSAYLVALTVFIPISGWAADRFGPRRIFAFALLLFTLASLLCAGSSNLTEFTLARVLQGIGGAMMVPVGRLVVLRDIPKQEMVRAIAILTWPALTAPLLGPLLGGWIATHWGWQWIFLLNIPLGLAAFVAALWLIPAIKPEPSRFDVKGFLLTGAGFGLFMVGIEMLSHEGAALLHALAVIALGMALLTAAVAYLRRAPNPLFNLAPIAIRTFRISVLGGSLFRIAISTAPFLLPLMFQLGFGLSAVQAGALLLWLFAGNLSMKLVTTWVMNRFGFKRVLIGNGLMVSAGFAAMALLTPNTPTWAIIAVLFVSGMNRSMQFTALNSLSFADVPSSQMRDANTLQTIFLRMNMGIGIAVGALALTVAAWVNGGSSAVATPQDFSLAMWFICGLSLLALLDCIGLPGNAGASVLQRPARTKDAGS